ncbi:MAG TPA: TonB family protein [Vicinamibacterales bacterium]|nr:TonB family protein [Vicinamibacterales bacterium]
MLCTLIRRAAFVAAVIVVVPVGAWAQTRTEAELLAQINKTPGDVAAYLDLAKIYVEQKRFDDAQRMLINAATVIGQLRSNRTLLGEPMSVQVPAPAPPGIATTKPLRVSGNVTEPKKIKDVKPVYPALAQTAGISGIVIAEIVVDTNGGVRDARILRSIPMLDQAALDAIRQWQYTPTTLNGVPVELVMTVTVNFTLGSEPAPAVGPAPVRVGGDIKEPRKIYDVKPFYPPAAQAAGVHGIVIIEAIIGVDGRVSGAKVLRGVPTLDEAAIDTVTQWVYEPTLLNGVPVPVVMTVTVNFTLK